MLIRKQAGRRAGLAVAAASAVLLSVFGTPAQAAPSGDQTALQEFRTPGDAGWFYTLNTDEAASAAAKYKFTKSANIGSLYSKAAPGRTAVHRLRLKEGGPSYMLAIAPSELSDARFVDEGIAGFTDTTRQPGEVQLLRFSNHGAWRVLADGRANIDNMKAAGYQVDGPLGWFHP